MKLTISRKPIDMQNVDLLVFFTQQDKDALEAVHPLVETLVKNSVDLGDFEGKAGQILMSYYLPGDQHIAIKAKRVLVVGLGDKKDHATSVESMETFRKIGGEIAGTARKLKSRTLGFEFPHTPFLEDESTAQALAEGMILGNYQFDKYKEKKKKNEYPGVQSAAFVLKKESGLVRKGFNKAAVACESAVDARNMANEPGNHWTSREFAAYARKLSEETGLKHTCLEKKDLLKLGMGGILAVNQGSAIPPTVSILEYHHSKKSQTVLLVGKGITFDSGGISIKPAAGMEEMKYDMCGGAAVLSTMRAVAAEKPSVNVVAIVPATDNMNGSAAVRPGDIIRHYNGVTSEIVNTDAEGRMILADALAYGIETYKPDAVIDIATLTGAVIVGLGHHHTGLMGNHQQLANEIIEAGLQAGEPVWQLPLTEPYKKQIESDVAQIKNIGGRPGGSITAAAYLSHFVGDTPWAHLDIAGTAWNYTKKSYIPKGPSGICTRTFIYLLRNWKKLLYHLP